jgi:ATP-dependent helicase/nuclease subunit A
VTLPDSCERKRIEEHLDTNFLVEAAAGTGKTTSMVRRMAALIASGRAEAAHIAAVTFTRKAASELKVRFVLELEKSLALSLQKNEEEKAARLRTGLEESGRSFVGTIHSFCARLLKERPVEAGIDPGFTELDDAQEARLRRLAFDEHMAGQANDTVQGHLRVAGLAPGDLFGLFTTMVSHPDVTRWPAPEPVPPDFVETGEALAQYMVHMRELLSEIPGDVGTDKLIPKMRRVVRMVRNTRDPMKTLDLFRILENFEPDATPRHKFYPGGKEQALTEAARWEAFKNDVAMPAVRSFMQYRYAAAVKAMLPAVESYRHMRRLEGALSYEDLLLYTAAMLRDNPEVRGYFADRFRYLLVDEFQDTDPVQAEVMLLLTGTDHHEWNWRRCVPRPGSLFVVGDPKQSIYRFRRADIVIYNEVRAIITAGGGEKLALAANFRSRPELLEWINDVFAPHFPEEETDEAPAYVPLSPGRETPGESYLAGVRTIPIPARCTNQRLIMEYEPDRISRTIRSLVDTGATVTGKDGKARPCTWADFLVVTMKKDHLSPFSSALDRFAIPHRITGGAAMGRVSHLADLYLAVRAAARPHDPVAAVAVLRSDLFAVPDPLLLELRLARGEFRWDRPLPRELARGTAEVFTDIFERLRLYARWLAVLAPVPALERITEDLGLAALAASEEDGDIRAGSIYKTFELLREAWSRRPTLDHVIETLHGIVTGEEEYDPAAVRPEPPSYVRVMNLHKVKGLEAPVVFLATPTGKWPTTPSLHIVREGSRGEGYAEIVGPDTPWGKGAPVAKPPGWDDTWAPREQAFLEAELIRLLYVAATRAGSMLVISHMEGMGGSHTWAFFNEHLKDAIPLNDPEDLEPPELPEADLGPDDDGDPQTSRNRWTALAGPTYSKEYPSRLADHTRPEAAAPTGEHGTEWGTVIHRLLEAAGEQPGKEPETLLKLAEALLVEEGLSGEHAESAVNTVRAVMKSTIWEKAGWAKTALREVPYTRLKKQKPRGPVLESGVMDLVFEEDDGWVIVDYKTGAMDREKYRPQLEAYREAWEAMGCGSVKEVRILFVDHDEYVIL